MTAHRSAAHSQGAIQETAQALVARGELAEAVRLLDRYLSEFDGDWGVWLYFGGLCARLGKREQAIAAYRACARQLEGDGHFARAREALMNAVRLTPADEGLKREMAQIGKPPAPRPDPKAQLTAVIPGRELTDPYIAIFDILDAERAKFQGERGIPLGTRVESRKGTRAAAEGHR